MTRPTVSCLCSISCATKPFGRDRYLGRHAIWQDWSFPNSSKNCAPVFPIVKSSCPTRFSGRQSDYIRFGRGYAQLDDVFYFENLETDAERLCRKLGIDWTGLPHERKGDRPRENELLDNNAKTLISALYKRDYFLFRYPLPTVNTVNSKLFSGAVPRVFKT